MYKKLILIATLWQCLAAPALLAQIKGVESSDHWIPLGLSPIVESQARNASKSYVKIQSFIRKNFYKLIDNASSIHAESEEFGIDYLIVAKLAFGVKRSVEKNPWPTSLQDQFLVKDELTIGYHLGAGLVVYGDIGYIKKYTLVRPVATHREGMLADDFIVDLMLPFQVRDQRLPKKYVLMTEGYVEGRGRIKVGGPIMSSPMVYQINRSHITLSRTFIDNRRPDEMLVFVDQGDMNEWGQLLYVTNGFLSYNLFKSNVEIGTTERKFYQVHKRSPEYNDILAQLTVHNNVEVLKDYALSNQVHDQFRQGSSDFSLFGLFSSHSLNRLDKIDEFYTNENGEVTLINQQYQHENERKKSWFSFISGEEFFSNILFTAYDNNGELGKPHIIINTRINDKKASFKEITQKYIPGLNKISLSKQTFSIANETLELMHKHKLHATFDMRIILDQYAIETLMNTSEEEYWDHLVKVTEVSRSRWKKALRPSVGRESIATRSDSLRPLALRFRSMAKRLDKLSDCDDNACRIKELTRMIKDAVYIHEGEYAPELLAVIHTMARGHVSIESNLGLMYDDQLIDDVSWDNGIHINVPQNYYRFNFQRAGEIYHLFDDETA